MKNKKIIISIGIVLVLLVGIFGFSTRIDLTQEKRYTLTDSTIKTLKSVKKPMMIEVYLDGDFPASFKQLQNETKFMLEEFRKINPKIDYKFIDPIKEKISRDTLEAMGMEPSILPNMKDGKISEIVLFPYAAVKYNTYGTAIPLIIQQTGIDASEQLNKSIENLEYNFVSTIKTMITEKRKNVGFLVNHDELRPDQFQGFLQLALDNYNVGPIIPHTRGELTMEDVPTLQKMDAIVIAKPRKPFTNQEKVILDQYIMNGGKTLWMLDAVNADMDTLYHSKKIMAYPQDLNLTDFMFNYGLRINSALVKDFQKAALRRIVVGEIAGNPQYASLLWPYFPLGINETGNPITRNINPLKFEFPTAIDTLGRPGIKTQVLYESSNRTTLKSTPNYVELSELQNIDSLSVMEKPSTPKIFAVALEGKFNSAYANRSEKNEYPKFKAKSGENKMMVISDGDVARNQVIRGEPLPLGEDLMTNQLYGNEQFLRNALEYLLDDNNLIELRSRSIEVRLLDGKRINDEKSYWQWLNLLLPLGIIGGMGALFFWLRKRKFA